MTKPFTYFLILLFLCIGVDSFGQTKGDLRQIIKTEDTLRLAKFIDNGFDVNSMYSKSTCFLNRAILTKKYDLTRFILKQENVKIQRVQKDGFTTLHYLVSNGWYSMAMHLIDSGVDPNTLGYINSHILRTVLADYQWRSNSDPSSLDFIKYLYEKGINPELSITCCPNKVTLLILSVIWADLPTVEYMLAKDYDAIDSTDHKLKTALHWAVQRNKVDMVKLLIENGANINLEDDKGKTAFDYAVKEKNDEIIKLFEAISN